MGDDGIENNMRVGGKAPVQEDGVCLVEHIGAHSAGVQMDSTVVAVLADVESHRVLSCENGFVTASSLLDAEEA